MDRINFLNHIQLSWIMGNWSSHLPCRAKTQSHASPPTSGVTGYKYFVTSRYHVINYHQTVGIAHNRFKGKIMLLTQHGEILLSLLHCLRCKHPCMFSKIWEDWLLLRFSFTCTTSSPPLLIFPIPSDYSYNNRQLVITYDTHAYSSLLLYPVSPYKPYTLLT